jgi:hypothetical protein
VTCHEHHDIAPPTDAMLGTEPKATCVMCHDESSNGFAAARIMKAGVVQLSGNLDAARELLQKAERAGMEVSKPLYDLSEGRDKLILARVDIHGFNADAVKKNLDEGEKIAAASLDSGRKALDDLAYRRKGFGISAAILLMMIGLLVVKIKQISNRA